MKLDNRHKRLIAGISAAAICAAGLGVFAMTHAGPLPTSGVPTAVAKMGDVEQYVLASGSLEPSTMVDVGSEVSGRVLQLKVALGDTVHQGDIIAVIDAERQAGQVRQQQQQLTQAENTLRDRIAQAALAQSEADRQKILLERGAASQLTYDQAVAAARSAQAQVENQRQQIDTQKLILAQGQADLDKTNIRAPMDGLVAQVMVSQGDSINTFNGTPVIVKLAQTGTMTVRAQVSEADIMKIRPGQKVYFTTLGQPDNPHWSTIAYRDVTPAGTSLDPEIAARAAPRAIYYGVTFDTPNADGALMPAMTVEVHVVLAKADHVLTIPSSAISPAGAKGERTVQVELPGGRLETRAVTLGVDNNFVAEVKSGLKAGEKVVVG